jgi:prepilin-type N-terminal cleavage/methylation domain-containing protein
MSKNTKKLTRHQGMSLVEVALALAVGGVALASLNVVASDSQSQIKDAAVASQISQIYTAANAYLKTNSTALFNATAAGPVSIPVAVAVPGGTLPPSPAGLPSLQGGGYLPASFVAMNSYGQGYALVFRRDALNPATNVEGLVQTTGHTKIKDIDLGRIAQKVGAAGGAIM